MIKENCNKKIMKLILKVLDIEIYENLFWKIIIAKQEIIYIIIYHKIKMNIMNCIFYLRLHLMHWKPPHNFLLYFDIVIKV